MVISGVVEAVVAALSFAAARVIETALGPQPVPI
jgi:hypothetical protein